MANLPQAGWRRRTDRPFSNHPFQITANEYGAIVKLYYHKDPFGNFGDDLNPWLMERLLPDTFTGHCYHDPALRTHHQSDEALFVGIGTLLNRKIPKDSIKAVFGSGAGYGPEPELDNRWRIYCVRGPRTAKRLGLPDDAAVTDGAALCSTISFPSVQRTVRYAFMPHCSTARSCDWELICSFSLEKVLKFWRRSTAKTLGFKKVVFLEHSDRGSF